MKLLNKFKKEFVINTKFIEKSSFNSPVYVIDSGKDFVETYSKVKQNPKSKNVKVVKNKLEFKVPINEKTFISVKEFFKKCKLESCEYRIEKINNGNIYILVAKLNELGLFFKTNQFENQLILTNLNCYNFQKTPFTAQEALSKTNYYSEFEQIKIANYLNNKKNLKRDYIFSLKKSLENLEKEYEKTLKK